MLDREAFDAEATGVSGSDISEAELSGAEFIDLASFFGLPFVVEIGGNLI